jgi:hypothetical protein
MITFKISDKGKKWFYLKIFNNKKIVEDRKFTDFDDLKKFLLSKVNLLEIR